MGTRVLFLYPNTFGMNMVPPAIAFLSALLKQEGHEAELFDSTYYDLNYGVDSEGIKAEQLNVVPFDLEARGIRMKTSDWRGDLSAQVTRFAPDLIAVSSTEDMWELALVMLGELENYIGTQDTPVIAGGVFPTFAPQLVINHPLIRMVCIGEGENALVDLCENLAKGESYESVTNLWVKRPDGSIKKNPISRPVDINENPTIDLSLFEEERLYRPMSGRIYKMFPIETHRGCPFTCRFCNSPDQMKLYDKEAGGGFFRKKSMTVVHNELKHLKDNLGCEYNYFWADTFLAMNNHEFDEFCEMYSDIKLPFWMQTRPETISEEKLRKLAEVGLHRISFGIEHGDEEFRKRLLDRRWKNDHIIEALKIPHRYDIQFSLNNITGFPYETRELAMTTVELNRKIDADNANIYSFVPFHGTPLRQLCQKEGLVGPETIARALTDRPMLDMPQYPIAEIEGLKKCFILYVKFPKNRWGEIRLAEENSDKGNRIYQDLKDEYLDKYFSPPRDNPKAEFPASADLEYGIATPT
jgi:radical SAM superfamily enzyme YgiQ (UPF0313 family)